MLAQDEVDKKGLSQKDLADNNQGNFMLMVNNNFCDNSHTILDFVPMVRDLIKFLIKIQYNDIMRSENLAFCLV